jgi:hypothetical protein
MIFVVKEHAKCCNVCLHVCEKFVFPQDYSMLHNLSEIVTSPYEFYSKKNMLGVAKGLLHVVYFFSFFL